VTWSVKTATFKLRTGPPRTMKISVSRTCSGPAGGRVMVLGDFDFYFPFCRLAHFGQWNPH
jgi:hypothetical protein